jgi:uncharacterized protein with HEPN domain
MREPLRDKYRLQHILDAIDRIVRYTKGKSFDEFTSDDMMYYAVVKNIEIIGEAANMLTSDFQTAHSEVPWKMVKGMRNYIVHEYFQVDSSVVWGVITNDIPNLRMLITQYLEQTNWEEWENKHN